MSGDREEVEALVLRLWREQQARPPFVRPEPPPPTATDPERRDRALPDVAAATAHTDPGRAERIAAASIAPELRGAALSRIVGAVVESDPDRADVVVARRHPQPSRRSYGLMRIALA